MALFDDLAQKYKVAKDTILSNPVVKTAQNYYNATQAVNPLTAVTNPTVRKKIYNTIDQVAQSPQLAQVKQKLNQPIQASPQVVNSYQKVAKFSDTISRPFELYGAQQVGVPALKAMQEDRKGNTLPALLSASQAGFNLTPKGIGFNTITGGSTSLAQASRNKDLASLPSNLIKNIAKPTSFATEGLGVQNPYVAMAIDLVTNGGDPRSVKSLVNSKNARTIASSLFGREKELQLNAEELIQAQKVLKNKTKFTAQEFEDAKNTIYNLAERHLNTDVRDKLVNSPAKLAKAIEQELNKPKPQVYPTLNMFANNTDPTQATIGGDLLAEAKKYKSAEEFVLAQGTILEAPKLKITKSQIESINESGVAQSAKLERLIDLPKLYKRYPDLKNIKVTLKWQPGSGAATDFNQIVISPSTADFKKNLLHEIQHILQKKEGLPTGGNHSVGEDINKYLNLPGEIQARNSEKGTIFIKVDKSQLTDIWNQAHSSGAVSELQIGSPTKLAKATEQELNKPKPQVYPTRWTRSSFSGESPAMGFADQAESVGTQKMRSFPERVTVSPNVPQEVKDATAKSAKSFYEPITNQATLKKAKDLVSKDEAAAISFARTNAGVDGNATALVLLEKYLKEGKFEQANQVIDEFSPRLTESGQAIQIMSKFGKLTPAGAVRYAKTLADKARVPLTEDKIRKIADKANELKGLAEGSPEKTQKAAELVSEIKDVVPPSLGQKISTIQTMSQLINPTTAIRNVGGNAIFAGLENVSDVLGAGLDKGLSLITGKRSKVLPDITAQAKGFKAGLKAGVSDAIKGIDTSNSVGTQFDLPSTMTFKKGVLNKLEKVMNIELKAPDRAAYQAAFDASISNQTRAAKLAQPTEEMLKVAHADALYKTFQDNSALAVGFGEVKKGLNKFNKILGVEDYKFGLGDLILKYPKTPANILSRGLDYSPAGFLKATYQVVRPLLSKNSKFDQKTFVETFSRAMVGTGLIAAGAKLAKDGIITGRPEKDKDIAATQRAVGEGPFKINVSALKRYFLSGFQPQKTKTGDFMATYDWAQPTAISITMGANYALGGSGQDKLTNFLESTDAAVEGLTQQSFMKSASQFVTDFNQNGVGSAFGKAVLNAPASFVPSLVSKVAQTIDRMARETYDPNAGKQAVNQVVNKIPVLRSTLPEKVDVFGRPVQYGSDNLLKRIIQNFVSPAIITKADIPASAQEVLDLFDRTGEVGQAPQVVAKKVKINGQNVNLTPQQMTQYQRYVGTKANDLITKLVNDPKYSKLDDQTKVNLITSYLSDINSAAKIELFGNKPDSISANVQAITKGKLPTTFNVRTTNGKIRITRLKKARVPKPKKIKVKTIKSRVPKSRKIKVKKIKV